MNLGVLFAAGASRRFGADDKLLVEWRGAPLVCQAANLLMAAFCDESVAVVSSPAVAAVLPAGMKQLQIPQGQTMSLSWRSALQYAQEAGADNLLIMLGDMPNLTDGILHDLIRRGVRFGNSACCLGDKALPPAFLALKECLSLGVDPYADQGARALIARIPQEALVRITSAEGLDIDVREDLQELEECQSDLEAGAAGSSAPE
ncbi:NTP transferase domain-containing protein [Rhodobacter sp. 24-YEA-8]|uniref:nucleotidyltransferase family protein n=1 Tax=Rhodobacter sp. 24-YEA-8 TaxID=1884310 RepID=UPI00089D27DA|nr:NTP transferase domain-containing protein [Rhodobacter sp. 24-YEA-8]SED66846.1 molybdenum cofactor cytidylyltransferase [Rhodobacter sp. 24-YEA-8]